MPRGARRGRHDLASLSANSFHVPSKCGRASSMKRVELLAIERRSGAVFGAPVERRAARYLEVERMVCPGR